MILPQNFQDIISSYSIKSKSHWYQTRFGDYEIRIYLSIEQVEKSMWTSLIYHSKQEAKS